MAKAWRVPILTYHGLHAPAWGYHENDHVALETDLATIRSLGFRVVPLSALVRHLFHQPIAGLDREKLVAISFDDGTDLDYHDFSHPDYGYLKSFNNLLMAQPGLGWDGGVPVATSFVIASPEARTELDKTCIAGRGQWGDDWWPEAVTTGALEIGNHSWDHTHPTLGELVVDLRHRGGFTSIADFDTADAEILNAEKFIREKTGQRSVPLFAYPYGEWNEFLVEEYFPARSEWISAAFTTSGQYLTADSSRFLLPRFVCGEHWNSPEGLVRILKD